MQITLGITPGPGITADTIRRIGEKARKKKLSADQYVANLLTEAALSDEKVAAPKPAARLKR